MRNQETPLEEMDTIHKCSCSCRMRHRLPRLLLPVVGLISLIWFLIKVIPKPSRAAYPCQRIAAPLASGFVLWLVGLTGSVLTYRKGKKLLRQSRFWQAGIAFAALAVACLVVTVAIPHSVPASSASSHGPIGEAKGIKPGRVVWVYNPEATDWQGYNSSEHWYDSAHTNQAIVDRMMSQAIRGVAGVDTDQDAWDLIFRYFNASHGRGDRGYQPGEKIMIKLNHTTCFQINFDTYEKYPNVLNQIDNSPQLVLALLRQLVNVAGINQSDISIGDPVRPYPNHLWTLPHSEFPNVKYIDSYGGMGRTKSEPSTTKFCWSPADSDGKTQDYLPIPYAQMSYFINFAILKGHSSGVTLCGKNNYGSLARRPDESGYFDLHASRPDAPNTPGMGHYRAIVDLMGHPQLGGKTLLCIIDGLFAGYYWESVPRKWVTTPFGDGTNGDWPSSIFASQDPVAIDSVAYDFLLSEWPNVVTGGTDAPGSLMGGAEDYLHEEALADNPPSGTFYDPDRNGVRMKSLGVHEHWNDPIHKQYSRNLGLNTGIELLSVIYDQWAIQHAKLKGNNSDVLVDDAVVTAVFTDCFYIESDDRTSGIRVEKANSSLSPGTRVNISGHIGTNANGERSITATSISLDGTGIVAPWALNSSALKSGNWNYNPTTGAGQRGIKGSSGLNTTGLLVRISGTFTYINPSIFTIKDGKEPIKCIVPQGVTINPKWHFVTVTGIASCENDGQDLYRVLKVRSQSDMTPY